VAFVRKTWCQDLPQQPRASCNHIGNSIEGGLSAGLEGAQRGTACTVRPELLGYARNASYMLGKQVEMFVS